MTEYLEIASANVLKALGYRQISRTFADVAKLLDNEQKGILGSYNPDETAYFFLDSTVSPKLPNITYLPNIKNTTGQIVLATTLGHQHTQKQKDDNRPFQEIYEFHGYGAMVLRNNKRIKMHILKPSEKICFGTDDNMTIINLNEHPLVTFDMANPSMNSADKSLEEKIKTYMHLYFYSSSLFIETNPEYKEAGLANGITQEVPLVVQNCKLGESLYERISKYSDLLAITGIELVIGGNLSQKQKEEFSDPLLTLVTKRNKTLLDSLGL